MEGRKPKATFRVGAVSATVWENEVEVGEEKKLIPHIKILKNYMDKDRNWQTSNSFSLQDLPKVQLAAAKAFEELTFRRQDDLTAEEKAVPEETID